MLEVSKLLIVDTNCLSFHTFDMLRWILANEKAFIPMLHDVPELIEFVQMSFEKQLEWAYTKLTPSMCKKIFTDRDTYVEVFKSFIVSPYKRRTETLLAPGVSTIFDNAHIIGAILQQKGDTYQKYYSTSKFRTYITNDIYDIGSIIKFVNEANFNAIMVDSIQVAAEMAYQTANVSYMIPSYRWNFDEHGQLLGKEHLNLTELENKNEFGIFNPYNFKEELNHGSNSEHSEQLDS